MRRSVVTAEPVGWAIPSVLLIAWIAGSVLPAPARAGLQPIGITVGSWSVGKTATLTALFIEDNGAEPVPPGFEFCARGGVTFGVPTVLYPTGTTVTASSGNDCWAGGGYQGTAYVIPGRTSDAANQVYKLSVPFTVPAGYAGVPNYVGGPLDPNTLALQILGASGTPGLAVASRTDAVDRVGDVPADAFTEEVLVQSRSSSSVGPALSVSKKVFYEGSDSSTVAFRIDVVNFGATRSGPFVLQDQIDPKLMPCSTNFLFAGFAPVPQPIANNLFEYSHPGLDATNLNWDPFVGLQGDFIIFCHPSATGSFENKACVSGGGDPRLPPGALCSSVGFPVGFGFGNSEAAASTITPYAIASYYLGTPGRLPELAAGTTLSFVTQITNLGATATPSAPVSDGIIGLYYANLVLAGAPYYYVVHADGTKTAHLACGPTGPGNDECRTASPLKSKETIVVVRSLRVVSPPPGGGLNLRDAAHDASGFVFGNRLSLAVIPGLPIPLPAPSTLTAKAIAGRKVTLAWKDNSSGEDSFRIEMRTGAAAFKEVASVAANKTSAVIGGLVANTRYAFRVRARKGTTFSAYSNAVAVVAIR
jgi:hypothetical protein